FGSSARPTARNANRSRRDRRTMAAARNPPTGSPTPGSPPNPRRPRSPNPGRGGPNFPPPAARTLRRPGCFRPRTRVHSPVAASTFKRGNTAELYGSLQITGRKQGRGGGDPFLQPKIAGHERAERGTPRSEIPMSSLSIPNRNRIAGARMRATKTGNSSRRAGSRSFGEYIFLEDSRYASQHKNMRRKRIYPPFA